MGLILNLLVQTIVWFGFMGAIIFVAAGTIDYVGGWLYLGAMVAVAVVFGLHMLFTPSDSYLAEISTCITWDSTTNEWHSTAKDQAENNGRRWEHDCGEPPSTGITTTSSRFNGVGSVQATYEPGPCRQNRDIVWSTLP